MHKSIGVAGLLLWTGLIAGCTAAGSVGIGANPSASPSASSSANPSTGGITVDGSVVANLPSPLEIASVTGIKGDACAQESSLKSSTGAATKIKFKNSSNATIRVYWLDFNGKRIEYINGNQAGSNTSGLAAGASFDQSTYVTHPWVITTANGDCLGVYTPTDTSNVVLDVKKTVSITGSASGGTTGTASGTVTLPVIGGATAPVNGVYSETQVRSALACFKGSGNASAVALANAWEFQLNAAIGAGKGADGVKAVAVGVTSIQKGFNLSCL
jgi:uncharacterized membrane protein